MTPALVMGCLGAGSFAGAGGLGCGARSSLIEADAGGVGAAGAASNGGGGAGQGGGGDGGGGAPGCGAQGESCGGDGDCCALPCIQGVCEVPCFADDGPVVLAGGLVDPYSMAGDSRDLYVGMLDGGKPILRLPKAGGTPEEAVGAVEYCEQIVIADGQMFYSSMDVVASVPVPAGAGAIPEVLAGVYGAAGIAVTPSKVYVAEYLENQLRVIDRESHATEVLAGALDGIYRVAATNSAVYFSNFYDGLNRYELGTGVITVIAPELGLPRAVLEFHDDIYYAMPYEQRIFKLPAGSDSPVLLAELSGMGVFVEALVTDGVYLYTTVVGGNAAEGAIVRVPIGGGAPEIVTLSGGADPSALVVDGACVYWTDRYQGNVYRAKKAP